MLPIWLILEMSKIYHMRSIFMSNKKYSKESKLMIAKGTFIKCCLIGSDRYVIIYMIQTISLLRADKDKMLEGIRW